MKRQPGAAGIHNPKSGVWYAIAAFSAWGVLPLYWKELKHVAALEILAHRFVWSFVFVALLITFLRQWGNLRSEVSERRKLLTVAVSSLLICANWGIFIWAVNTGHVVDASLGYYINPLFSICLGVLVLGERLNFWQLAALIIAACGVVIFAWDYGKIPWIALLLATTFGLYGLVKKMANIESMIGLTLETMLLTPVALGYLLWLHHNGMGAFGNSPLWINILLAGAGVVTALPLLWFSRAAQSTSLSVVGFTQYLTPTMMLLLGLFLYHEAFTLTRLAGFGSIWLALVLFSCSQLKFMRECQPARFRGRRETVELPVIEDV